MISLSAISPSDSFRRFVKMSESVSIEAGSLIPSSSGISPRMIRMKRAKQANSSTLSVAFGGLL